MGYSYHFFCFEGTDFLAMQALQVGGLLVPSSGDFVDVFQHFVVKLVNLVFEELSYLPAGRVDLVLVLQPAVLQLVQVLDHVENAVVEQRVQLLLAVQVDVLLHQMPHRHAQQKLQDVQLALHLR